MVKIEKSWKDLPCWFKKVAIGYLDFKSRRQLRACSKQDKLLVDHCPLSLKKLAFFLTKNRGSLYLTTFSKTATKHSLLENEFSILDLIQDFIRIFQHPKTSVEELTMEFSELEKSKMLIEEILKSKGNCKFRVKKIIWYSCPTNIYAVEFLKFLDTTALKCIRFEYQNKNLEMMKELMKNEQWKCAEELITSTVLPVGIEMEKFSHAKRLKIKVHDSDFSVEKIQDLITTFKSSNHTIGSYFSILTHFKMENPDEGEMVESSKPIVVDGRTVLPKTKTFFPMPDGRHFLLIHRYDTGIEGLVRDNNIPVDYFIL